MAGAAAAATAATAVGGTDTGIPVHGFDRAGRAGTDLATPGTAHSPTTTTGTPSSRSPAPDPDTSRSPRTTSPHATPRCAAGDDDDDGDGPGCAGWTGWTGRPPWRCVIGCTDAAARAVVVWVV